MSKKTLQDFTNQNGLKLGWDKNTGNVTVGDTTYTKDTLQSLGGSLVNNRWQLPEESLNKMLSSNVVNAPAQMVSSNPASTVNTVDPNSFEQIMKNIQSQNQALMEQLTQASKDAFSQINNTFAEFERKKALEAEQATQLKNNQQAYLQAQKQQNSLNGLGSKVASAGIQKPVAWDGRTNSVDVNKTNLPNNSQDSGAISRYLAKDIWANK